MSWMNLLNEEIRVIQTTMSHVKKAIPLAEDSGTKLKLEEKYNALEKVLTEKLNECGDYKG